MEFKLRGTWGQEAKLTQTAKLVGVGSVNGLTANSSMSGTIKVIPQTAKYEIRIEFSDTRGAKYIIEAAKKSIAGRALGMKLTGYLTHEGDRLGTVILKIDLALLKEATLSFGKEATRKLKDRFDSLRKNGNANRH